MPLSPFGLDAMLSIARVTNKSQKLAAGFEERFLQILILNVSKL